jgi:hypothetical protein
MTRVAKLLFLTFSLAVVAAGPVAARTGLQPVVIKPRAGEVLQGTVTVAGSSNMPGFLSAEIAFAYSGDTTETWFLLAASGQPVEDGTLATWDTTTISDGDYILRLRVTLTDGSYLDATVPDLRVRNYTPVETLAPASTAPPVTLAAISTSTATPYPTPTPLPPNPAELTPTNVWVSIGYGGLGAFLLFGIISIYLWLRRK